MSRTRQSDGPAGQWRRRDRGDIRPLPDDENLFIRWRGGDVLARDQLVERFSPLAARLAYRYRYSGEPLDDLEQVALIGLIKAIDSFETDRETPFAGYAPVVILGEIRHHFRDHTWVMHVPGRLRELTQRVGRATAALSEQLRREPSVREIAESIGVSVEDVLEARHATGARRALSFGDARGGSGDDGGGAMTLGDLITIHEDGFSRAEDRAMLESLLGELSERQRVVLHLRFDLDLTQSQIANVVGISQVHVSRVIRDGLELMRATEDERCRASRLAPAGRARAANG
jgi:RNA polymerase sigma-B factor